MKSVIITSENARDIEPLIGESLCADMTREYFRGRGLSDDNNENSFVGAMVYELKNVESETDTESEIRFLSSDPDIAEELIDEYDFAVSDEEIKWTHIETEEEALASVLEDFGFSFEKTESKQVMIGIDKLGSLPGINKVRLPTYVLSLKDISDMHYRTMIKTCYVKGHGGALEDLPYLPKDWFDPEISTCTVSDGKVDGILLVKRVEEKMLQVVLYAAFGPEFKKNLSIMIIYAARKVLELSLPDTKIIIHRRNETVSALTKKLFPDCHGKEVYVGERSE